MSALKLATALALLAVAAAAQKTSTPVYRLARAPQVLCEDLSCPLNANGNPEWEYGLGSGRKGELQLVYNEDGTFGVTVTASTQAPSAAYDVHSNVVFQNKACKAVRDASAVTLSAQDFVVCGFSEQIQPTEVKRTAKLHVRHRFKVPGQPVDIIGSRDVTVEFYLTLSQPAGPIVVNHVQENEASLAQCAYVEHEIVAVDAQQNNFYQFSVVVKNPVFPRSSDVGFNLQECRLRPTLLVGGAEVLATDADTYTIIRDGKFTSQNFLQDYVQQQWPASANPQALSASAPAGHGYSIKVKNVAKRGLTVVSSKPQRVECSVCLCKIPPASPRNQRLNLDVCGTPGVAAKASQVRSRFVEEDDFQVVTGTPQNLMVSAGQVQVVQRPQQV